jgi:hypothetical protein
MADKAAEWVKFETELLKLTALAALETVEKLWSLTITLLKSPRALRGPLWQRGRGGNPPLGKGGLGGIYQQLLSHWRRFPWSSAW